MVRVVGLSVQGFAEINIHKYLSDNPVFLRMVHSQRGVSSGLGSRCSCGRSGVPLDTPRGHRTVQGDRSSVHLSCAGSK